MRAWLAAASALVVMTACEGDPMLVRTIAGTPPSAAVEVSSDFGQTWERRTTGSDEHELASAATSGLMSGLGGPAPEALAAQKPAVIRLARRHPESRNVGGVDFFVHPSDADRAFAMVFCRGGAVPSGCASQVFLRDGGRVWERLPAPGGAEQPEGQSAFVHGFWEMGGRTVGVLTWTALCPRPMATVEPIPDSRVAPPAREPVIVWHECGGHRISYDAGATFVPREDGRGLVRAASASPWRTHREQRMP